MADKNIFASMRKSYERGHLIKSDLENDPMVQFKEWMQNAIDSEVILEPNSMTLATATQNGKPSARQVLLKKIENGKLIWFTNYRSRKGHELLSNPCAALLFWWEPLQRQVRIEGAVSKTSDKISDEYFASRPYGSQVAALTSPQSGIVHLKVLKERFLKLEDKYNESDEIPRPEHWGGFSLEPQHWEFWQGRPNRLHDRYVYELKNGEWEIARLAP